MHELQQGRPVWYLQQDQKKNCTQVGHILIKFYLDELPQLLQVLSGKMSLVGPRPRPPSVYEEDLKQGYTALKFIKGGLAGPHQMSKGTPYFSLERSEEYLEKHQTYGPLQLLFYDLYVMYKTFMKTLEGEGL